MKATMRKLITLAILGGAPLATLGNDAPQKADFDEQAGARVEVLALNSAQIESLKIERERHRDAREKLEEAHRQAVDSILGKE